MFISFVGSIFIVMNIESTSTYAGNKIVSKLYILRDNKAIKAARAVRPQNPLDSEAGSSKSFLIVNTAPIASINKASSKLIKTPSSTNNKQKAANATPSEYLSNLLLPPTPNLMDKIKINTGPTSSPNVNHLAPSEKTEEK